MLVLLRASADGASPISRLRPRPVPLMVAATEEPVLRPQLKGAAALTGTATGVAVSGFKVAALGLAAALYAGPLALPELPGSELGPYVLVRPAPLSPLPPSCTTAPAHAKPPARRDAQIEHSAASRLHARVVQVPALGGLASCALCAAVSPPEDESRADTVSGVRRAGSAADVSSSGGLTPNPRSGSLYGSGIGPDLAGHAADLAPTLTPALTPTRTLTEPQPQP